MVNWQRDFVSLIITDSTLVPNNYDLRLHIEILAPDLLTQNVCFERIKFFTDYIIHGSAFIDHKHKEIKTLDKKFPGTNLIKMPCHVFDQAIGIMLFCKLQAICENHVSIKAVELSSEVGDNVSYVIEEGQDLIMFHKSKWFKQYKFLDPWWHRGDMATYDKVTSEKVEGKENKVSWYQGHMTWDEIGLGWKQAQNPIDKAVKKDSILKGPWKWKPVVIDGGKTFDKP
jgi:hypothetical protein